MKDYKTFDKEFWKWLSPFLGIIILILFLPYLLTLKSCTGISFNNDSGLIGDTIGGIIGPFVAIVAALLTFVAFWIQYKANKIQVANFKEQGTDIKIDRFENKFFELIRLHRANVDEITYKEKYKGREAFVEMFYELRYSFYTVKKIIEDMPAGTNSADLGFSLDDDENILKISYIVYFLGINNNYKSTLHKMLKKYCSDHFIQILLPSLESTKRSIPHETIFKNGLRFEYNPHGSIWEGVNSIIGHYYRHLYQCVKYTALFNNTILNNIQKYNYTKIIRAQLSNYEQLLLYYNGVCPFGGAWIRNGYFTDYKMIKNIPLPLADFGIKPEIMFANEIKELQSKGEELFEWEV